MIIEKMLAYNSKKNILLNVKYSEICLPKKLKELKSVSKVNGVWTEDFKESQDPRGQKYYWLTGSFDADLENTKSDLWALRNGYVSIVPSQHNLTDYESMDSL